MTDVFYGGGIVLRGDFASDASPTVTLSSNADKVKEFMKAFGQQVRTAPTLVDEPTADLRYNLIDEELAELAQAIAEDDLVGIADALSDLLYVVYGAAHTFGIPIDKCFNEVHRSNMSKLGEDGKPIYREDGKVLKGPNFTPPQLEQFINNPES